MTNKEIAASFRMLARIMEFSGENPFKIRSYSKAYDVLRKRDEAVAPLSIQELQQIDGIGKAISEKIITLVQTGELPQLNKYLDEAPPGASELLMVRGLGPKKVRQLIDELHVQSVGELLQAIRENRLVGLKGFAAKTQEKLRQQLEFHQQSKGFARYADIRERALNLLNELQKVDPKARLVGEFARQLPVISSLTYLISDSVSPQLEELGFKKHLAQDSIWNGDIDGFAVNLHLAASNVFAHQTVIQSSSTDWLAQQPELQQHIEATTQEEVFAKAGLPFTTASQRELASPTPPTPANELIQLQDIKGVVHAHTTYSDGATSIEVLAKASKKAGFEYLTVTDHSKVATYANGLSIERLAQQVAEIKSLNESLTDFTIFSGTECDILRDGSLDYPNEVLRDLDLVIASVHSILHMSKEDATQRVIRAIEHPEVDMLGHPTGRLLLSREGYPLDIDKVLEACQANHVAIEINANPYRLDLDWTHVRQAVDKGILISINPDAHAISGLDDIEFGVLVAQKAGLRPSECLNARDANGFRKWLSERS